MNDEQYDHVKICATCKTVTKLGRLPISHGVCHKCYWAYQVEMAVWDILRKDNHEEYEINRAVAYRLSRSNHDAVV